MKLDVKKFGLGVLIASASAGCSKKDDAETTTATASSVAELKLSSTLKLDIPDTLETAAGGSSSTSLALTAGKKSSEACRVMEDTSRVLSNLKSIGSLFCHLEIESDKMKFGTKYNVQIVGDSKLTNESMSIWVDNADPAKLNVYTCEGGKLKEQFTISGFGGEGKIKGSLAQSYSDSEGGAVRTGSMNLEFDFTTQGVKLVKSSSVHSEEGGSFAGSFRSVSDISLLDSGVSTIKMSSSGTRGEQTMGDQGALMFNGTMGQALFTGSGTYAGNTYNFTSRSTFDKDGLALPKADATADIVIDKASLPAKLAADFVPAKPAGWDCSGATETVVVDMTEASKKAAHDACNEDHGKSFSQCWGEGFAFGDQE